MLENNTNDGCLEKQGIHFNKEQQCAVEHLNGTCLVLAGPGSGKTTVIVGRIANLIYTHHVLPEQILTITFTQKAAMEMKQRATKEDASVGKAVFGTFHSVFYHILKQHPNYQKLKPCTNQTKYAVLKEILYANHFETEQIYEQISQLIREISCYKNKYEIMKEKIYFQSTVLEESQFSKVYLTYRKRMMEMGKLDFDDMLLLCYEHLYSDDKARAFWQNYFKYIQIDEFQDINGLQYEIVKLLLNEDKNLFVVGDDDQSIYQFRGSDPGFMRTLIKDFAGTKEIILCNNYRCHTSIIKISSAFISRNQNRFSKEYLGCHENGRGYVRKVFSDEEPEVDFICEELEKLCEKDNDCEIAILFRTNRAGSFISEILSKIGYEIVKMEKTESIYEHSFIQLLFSYFSFAISSKRSDFLQIMNKPLRYISRDAIMTEQVNFNQLLFYYGNNREMIREIKKMERDIKFLRGLDAYSGYLYIMKKIGVEKYIYDTWGTNKEKREEVGEILSEFEKRAKYAHTIDELLSFSKNNHGGLNEKTEGKNSSKIEEQRNHHKQRIHILTYHASKGLEFDYVFLPGVNANVVPHKKAITQEELEEERRMFYVAMTRAKKSLYISSVGESAIQERNHHIGKSNQKESVWIQELKEYEEGINTKKEL